MKRILVGLFSIAVFFYCTTVNSFNFDSFVNNVKEKANTIKNKVNTVKGKVDTDQNKQKLAQVKNSKTGSGILSSVKGSWGGCTAANAKKDPIPTKTLDNCNTPEAFDNNPNFTKALRARCSSSNNSAAICDQLSLYDKGCTVDNATSNPVPDNTVKNCFGQNIDADFATAYEGAHCANGDVTKQCVAIKCSAQILGATKLDPKIQQYCISKQAIILNLSTNLKAYTDKYCGTTTKKADPKKINACALIKKVQAQQKAAALQEATAKKAVASAQKAAEEAEEDEDIDIDTDIDADNDDDGDIDADDDSDIPPPSDDSEVDNSDVDESNTKRY